MGKVSLDKFAKGAFKELFNREMSRVGLNIYDPNTSAKAKRTITMKITIVPDEDRGIGDVTVTASSTLCPAKGASTRMLFGYNQATGQVEYNELNSEMLGQVSMEDIEALAGEKAEERENKVVDIDLRKKAEGAK